MKNRFIMLFLAGALLLSLAACGGNGKDTQTSGSGDQPAEENRFEACGGEYAAVLETYFNALSEQWDAQRLMDEEISLLLAYCYEGDAVGNVGFKRMDLNGDGSDELIIGAISGDAFVKGKVFALYTLADGKIVPVFSSMERDRYYVVRDEAGGYYFANEASASAFNSAWFYETLDGAELKVTQAILYNAEANADAPWFMAYDKSWDVSTAEPTDADTALAIIAANESSYVTLDYAPFSDCAA